MHSYCCKIFMEIHVRPVVYEIISLCHFMHFCHKNTMKLFSYTTFLLHEFFLQWYECIKISYWGGMKFLEILYELILPSRFHF